MRGYRTNHPASLVAGRRTTMILPKEAANVIELKDINRGGAAPAVEAVPGARVPVAAGMG